VDAIEADLKKVLEILQRQEVRARRAWGNIYALAFSIGLIFSLIALLSGGGIAALGNAFLPIVLCLWGGINFWNLLREPR